MSGNLNNGVHLEQGEKGPTLTMKETKTYRSTIANPASGLHNQVQVEPTPEITLSYTDVATVTVQWQ